jgi:CRISPR/Cas system-associated protein Cas5 (RAMP superfamily)
MNVLPRIDAQTKQCIEDFHNLIKQQGHLVEQLKQLIKEKEEHLIPLVPTIQKLIEHGLSRDEILDITNISSEEFDRILSENKHYQLPYTYLNDEESKEFERLLEDIHQSKDIYELIDAEKERERIKFIHRVLLRYQKEMDLLSPQENEDSGEKIMKYLERAVKNEQAKSAYSSLVRIFGNEIKRKREEVLIKVSDD